MPYYLILALQAFCIYHIIKYRSEYYWIFVVIFLPVLGSIIYIFMRVYNKRDAEKIGSEIVTIINPTKKIKDLESKLAFSDTFQNRVDLADAYYELGDYENAIEHYKASLTSNHQNDYYVHQKLIASFHNTSRFEELVHYAQKISGNKEFIRSKSQYLYGLALAEIDKWEAAEEQLDQIDMRYSNYDERLGFAKLLLERGNKEKGFEILKELHGESQHMNKQTKKNHRATFMEVTKLLNGMT